MFNVQSLIIPSPSIAPHHTDDINPSFTIGMISLGVTAATALFLAGCLIRNWYKYGTWNDIEAEQRNNNVLAVPAP